MGPLWFVWVVIWNVMVSNRGRPREGAWGAQRTYRGGSRERLQGETGPTGRARLYRGGVQRKATGQAFPIAVTFPNCLG